ncbi:MAG: hypothetical protein AAFO15_02560 [Pseudomonadota bacterium]
MIKNNKDNNEKDDEEKIIKDVLEKIDIGGDMEEILTDIEKPKFSVKKAVDNKVLVDKKHIGIDKNNSKGSRSGGRY